MTVSPWFCRRDLWLIPLISLLTVAGLLLGTEIVARYLYVEQLSDSCRVPDPVLGGRFVPNCTSSLKAAEGPWYTSHYNRAGYRTAANWMPLPTNTRRVVVIGTSIAQGYLIPYEQTAGATLAASLTSACHAPVEVPNLGTVGFLGGRLISRLNAALTLRPSLVMLIIAPHDLQYISDAAPADAPEGAGRTPADGAIHRLIGLARSSHATFLAEHFLFRNPDLYVPLYLHYGDQADFLRLPLSAAWQRRLRIFDGQLGELAAIGNAAGVKLALTYVPQEAQTIMLSRSGLPPNVDATAFGKAVGELARRHGMLYHDATLDFADLPDPQGLYYTVDGHVSGRGQMIVGRALARQVLSDVPDFAPCSTASLTAVMHRQ